MGRNCISRYVNSAPIVKGLRPFGRLTGKRKSVVLNLDEYEVIRLLDYAHQTQEEAALQMQVSRPTLTRIYERARVKFSTALVEGCTLLIEGGEVMYRSHSFQCNHCHSSIQNAENQLTACPRCNSTDIDSLDECHQKSCKQCRKCFKGGRHART